MGRITSSRNDSSEAVSGGEYCISSSCHSDAQGGNRTFNFGTNTSDAVDITCGVDEGAVGGPTFSIAQSTNIFRGEFIITFNLVGDQIL